MLAWIYVLQYGVISDFDLQLLEKEVFIQNQFIFLWVQNSSRTTVSVSSS